MSVACSDVVQEISFDARRILRLNIAIPESAVGRGFGLRSRSRNLSRLPFPWPPCAYGFCCASIVVLAALVSFYRRQYPGRSGDRMQPLGFHDLFNVPRERLNTTRRPSNGVRVRFTAHHFPVTGQRKTMVPEPSPRRGVAWRSSQQAVGSCAVLRRGLVPRDQTDETTVRVCRVRFRVEDGGRMSVGGLITSGSSLATDPASIFGGRNGVNSAIESPDDRR